MLGAWRWIKKRWQLHRSVPLHERLAVDFDKNEIHVRVLKDLDPAWNQVALWSDITRVCFKDEGLWSSDSLFLSLRNTDTVVHVLTEARGGSEFFDALRARGYFPEHVSRKAIRDTSGGLHCWPPVEE